MVQRIVEILALVLLTAHASAQKAGAQAAARDALIGVWGGGETILGPQVRGAVLVERVAGIWTLRTSGFEATGAMSGDSLVLRLSGGQGTLRAWLHGETLDEFWVQPGGVDGPSYSTPVKFHRER